MLLIAEQTDIHEVSGIDHRSMGGNASIFYLSGKHWLDVTNQNFWQDFLIIAFLIQLAEAMIVTCSIDDENLIPELIHKLCQTHGKFFVADGSEMFCLIVSWIIAKAESTRITPSSNAISDGDAIVTKFKIEAAHSVAKKRTQHIERCYLNSATSLLW